MTRITKDAADLEAKEDRVRNLAHPENWKKSIRCDVAPELA